CSNRTATATTALYTLSLHDALPIYVRRSDRPTAANARLGRRWTKGVERSSDVLHAAEQLERVRRGRAAAQLRGGGARAGHLQLGAEPVGAAAGDQARRELARAVVAQRRTDRGGRAVAARGPPRGGPRA